MDFDRPYKVNPVYKQKIWGGNKIKKLYNIDIDIDNIGERWDVVSMDNDQSIIDGIEFDKFVNIAPDKVLGNYTKMPLLIKTLDAKDDLSIQVHPADTQYTNGKTEMWYILDAEPNSELVVGIEDISPTEIKEHIKNGTLDQKLKRIKVKKGDVIYIPAGCVHAICKGIMLLEIQQTSDVTYRLYDYNRLGLDGKLRELHIDEAIEALDPKKDAVVLSPKEYRTFGLKKQVFIKSKYFCMETLDINASKFYSMGITPPDSFACFSIIEGSGSIRANGEVVDVAAGDTVFLPNHCFEYFIKGNLKLVKSWMINNKEFFNYYE